MEEKYRDIARQKSTDALIDILLNKDEYKPELVDAVEQELKRRKKEGNIINNSKSYEGESSTNIQKDKQPGIYVAAIFEFITFPLWLTIAIIQAGASGITQENNLGYLAIWNVFFAAIRIVLGIGILQLKEWGYQWGLMSAVLGLLWYGYNYIDTDYESIFFLFLVVIEITIALSLFLNRSCFGNTETFKSGEEYSESLDNDSDLLQKNNDEEYVIRLKELNSLIEKERKAFLGSNGKIKIIELLKILCTSERDSETVLKMYNKLFGADLIKDVISLSSNYDIIKEYLQVFIEYEIVRKDYPHERIRKSEKINIHDL